MGSRFAYVYSRETPNDAHMTKSLTEDDREAPAVSTMEGYGLGWDRA
jgi:hypothetical protein